MKKITIFCILSICLLLSSCYGQYSGKRPYDYGEAKWICENPPAWFVIDDDADDNYPEGEFTFNNQTLPLKMFFDYYDNSVSVSEIPPDEWFDSGYKKRGFDGECEFSPEQLIIKIDENTDTLFNGLYNKLVFTRYSDDDSQSDDEWQNLVIENVGALKIPAEWTYYYEDELLYIVDDKKSLVAAQSKSYAYWFDDTPGIVESNSFLGEVQQLSFQERTSVSYGVMYGTAEMKTGDNKSENYYIRYFGDPNFQIVFWDETVSEDLVAKIAWSFDSAG